MLWKYSQFGGWRADVGDVVLKVYAKKSVTPSTSHIEPSLKRLIPTSSTSQFARNQKIPFEMQREGTLNF